MVVFKICKQWISTKQRFRVIDRIYRWIYCPNTTVWKQSLPTIYSFCSNTVVLSAIKNLLKWYSRLNLLYIHTYLKQQSLTKKYTFQLIIMFSKCALFKINVESIQINYSVLIDWLQKSISVLIDRFQKSMLVRLKLLHKVRTIPLFQKFYFKIHCDWHSWNSQQRRRLQLTSHVK